MKNYQKIEQYNPETIELVKNNFTEMLKALGEDVTRNGLEKNS